MTAAILQKDLQGLITDSKRKNNDIRVAAEKSLSDLKTITVTSEAQLAADLVRRTHFINPFLLGCQSGNGKLEVTATICLQRLVASKAVPPNRLQDVLDAFQHVLNSGTEIQLKILQTLPSLLSLYASSVHGGGQLARVLEICANLVSTKAPAVRSTAAATFQQLLASVFEHDKSRITGESEVNNIDQSAHSLSTTNQDVTAIIVDLYACVNHERTKVLALDKLPMAFVLEVVFSIMSNHADLLIDTPERLDACKHLLLPGLLKIVQGQETFPIHVRSLRILYVLLDTRVSMSFDIMLDLLLAVVDSIERDAGPLWKRASSLEFLRAICSDFDMLCRLVQAFDARDESGQPISRLMAGLVRISSEDPTLIGLGKQSTIPQLKEEEIASVEDQGLGSGGGLVSAKASVTGVSLRWSTMATPCLDQPDRPGPPTIPTTYLYTLALACVTSFADGLSKNVTSLSIASRGDDAAEVDTDLDGDIDASVKDVNRRMGQSNHNLQEAVISIAPQEERQHSNTAVCATLVDKCWPAVLATCSTFLNAALDSHFYHMLVRSVQKLAQVSGVLELATPRDAFLTTLAKSTMPSNSSTIIQSIQAQKFSETPKKVEDGALELNDLNQPVQVTSRTSQDVPPGILNIRHLLCLRALLHLGIALGPNLQQEAWSIIFEVLQQVETLLSLTRSSRTISAESTGKEYQENSDEYGNFKNETNAVHTASKRLLESTRTYNDLAFERMVTALLHLRTDWPLANGNVAGSSPAPSPRRSSFERPLREPKRSMSAVLRKPSSNSMFEVEFVLTRLAELAHINLDRFCVTGSKACSWDLFINALFSILSDIDVASSLRLRAASIVNTICTDFAKIVSNQKQDVVSIEASEMIAIATLKQQVHIVDQQTYAGELPEDIAIRILHNLLQAIETMVGGCGEYLHDGWRIVLDILDAAFSMELGECDEERQIRSDEALNQLIPAAFRTVQLIMSDFLETLTPGLMTRLAPILEKFGSQDQDLNISLTTMTLFWNLMSNLAEKCDTIEVNHIEACDFEARYVKSLSASDDWLAAALRLADLCLDPRDDVRNAALRVLLKALGSSSTRLSANTWMIIMHSIFFRVVESYTIRIHANDAFADDWEDSARQLIEGMTNLLDTNRESVVAAQDFETTWAKMLAVFENFLEHTSLATHTTVFSSLRKILRALHQLERGNIPSMEPVISLWFSCNPLRCAHTSSSSNTSAVVPSNQECLTSFVVLFLAVFDLDQVALSNFRTDSLKTATDLLGKIKLVLQETIFGCVHPPYSADVKKPSAEQEAVLGAMEFLKILMSHEDSAEKGEYASYVVAMVEQAMNQRQMSRTSRSTLELRKSAPQRPSYVAFLNKCVSIIRRLVEEGKSGSEFARSVAADRTMTCLRALIAEKHRLSPAGHDSSLVQSAIIIFVELLEALQSRSADRELSDSTRSIIVDMTNQALADMLDVPDFMLKPTIESSADDDTFTVDMLKRYHRAAVPLLSRLGRDTQQRTYILTLFHASLVAKPWFFDLPDDLAEKPLRSLMKTRRGTICQPVFMSRDIKSYAALEALLELIAFGSGEAFSVARPSAIRSMAAQYVLVRVAHPLKVFLSDQPLRGLTPMPVILQRELSTLLQKYVGTECDDNVFVGVAKPVFIGSNKTHLKLLQPLILEFKAVWNRLPRLGGPGTWQEEGLGKEIGACLMKWEEVTTETRRILSSYS